MLYALYATYSFVMSLCTINFYVCFLCLFVCWYSFNLILYHIISYPLFSPIIPYHIVYCHYTLLVIDIDLRRAKRAMRSESAPPVGTRAGVASGTGTVIVTGGAGGNVAFKLLALLALGGEGILSKLALRGCKADVDIDVDITEAEVVVLSSGDKPPLPIPLLRLFFFEDLRLEPLPFALPVLVRSRELLELLLALLFLLPPVLDKDEVVAFSSPVGVRVVRVEVVVGMCTAGLLVATFGLATYTAAVVEGLCVCVCNFDFACKTAILSAINRL